MKKHPAEWMTKIQMIFSKKRKILKKKNLLLPDVHAIIIKRDCTKICDEAGGCRLLGGEFLPSMSDFKPGDKKYC